MNIISNRPTHPNVIFIYTKIDPQNSTGRGGWEEATAGPRELGLGEAKGCVAYISPGAPFPPLCAHTPGRGHRQAEPSSRTPSRRQTPPNDASGVTTSSVALRRDGAEPRTTRSPPATASSRGYYHLSKETRSPDPDSSVRLLCRWPSPRACSSPVPGCPWVAQPPQRGEDSKETWRGGKVGIPNFDSPSCSPCPPAPRRVTEAPAGESPERWLLTVGFAIFF